MNHSLSDQQINGYRQDGFLLVEDFLNESELAVWRESIDEAMNKREGRRLPFDESDPGKKAGNEHVFTQRINLWMDHPGVKKLMIDERIGKMAARLEGVDGIRVWHDQALVK
ncbi:MAG: phytanoyl-CoA dioxygenase family protein, partial [Candidatus Latescibacteria bacterium]|nr:phytanoyl-CoA dioxygenase family protein [Candidatus Latescibacterota bacterium]